MVPGLAAKLISDVGESSSASDSVAVVGEAVPLSMINPTQICTMSPEMHPVRFRTLAVTDRPPQSCKTQNGGDGRGGVRCQKNPGRTGFVDSDLRKHRATDYRFDE